ncbi:MAG: hypothetical protein NZ529_02470 [Cytophagaceae bacterium]|nr:hypothetical protein [Cytophagaceae bacterium]MDW8455634.1 hypothetical protein [Cytophagaceae bacterium]
MYCSAFESGEEKKMLLLFDEINKQKEYDEEKILENNPSLKASQISNLKAYLYEKILNSLRTQRSEQNPNLLIRKWIDYAQILFERTLYEQGSFFLKKAKKTAAQYNNLELMLEIIKWEKSVLMLTSQDKQSKVDDIIEEVKRINKQINNINIFSNLSIKMDSYYRQSGHIRDKEKLDELKKYIDSNLPEYDENQLSPLEKMYLYRLYIGFYFYIQDAQQGYAYSKKLTELFESTAGLIESNTEDYIRSLNALIISQYKLMRYDEFVDTNEKLQNLENNPAILLNENLRLRLLKYHFIHEINHFFMTGRFEEGVKSIMHTQKETFLNLLENIDKHSLLIFNYKIACLYFGARDYNQCIRWLQKIINEPDVDFREDLHCFARIINLICHYELGNFDVIKYYIITTYKFLLKKDDLYLFQKYILAFLKKLKETLKDEQVKNEFIVLKKQLMPLVNSPYEKRAFAYFDIISWLESKIEKRSVEEIIQEKFRQLMKK